MKKVIPGKIKTQLRLDGYYNVLNKYGTQHDSTEYYQWASGSAVSDTELADLYAGNGLFSTIIDAPADDATKNGIDLGIKDKDLQKQIDNHLQTIRFQSKFAKALRWARLFGGAAVVMLVDDGRLLQDPLNWRDVHGVEELLVYGRNEMYPLWVSGYENNPDDEDYRRGGTGIPEYYQVNSVYGNYVVHSSRCLVFHNSDIPESSTMANLYRTWGIPEYLRIREELRNASIGPGYSIRLLERLSMVTYKMKNLAGVLSTADGEDTVLQRMEMLDLARNLLNMVIIDADGEDVGVQSLSVAGVKDILDNACAMLSAVSHIPQTRLFGRSPAGENATGVSDLENYKEFVGGLQNGDLRDNTRTLVELTLRGMVWNRKVKEIPEYTVTYKSAWSPSDDEKAAQDQAAAAAQLTRAQTVGTYVTNGIVEAEEVRRAMVRDEQFDPENILRKRTFTKTGDLEEPMPSRKPLIASNRMPRMSAVLLPMKETAAMWRALSCRTARSSAGAALMAKAGVAPAGISSRKKRRGWPSAGKPKKSLELTLEILPILVTVKENQKKSSLCRYTASTTMRESRCAIRKRCSPPHGSPQNRFLPKRSPAGWCSTHSAGAWKNILNNWA